MNMTESLKTIRMPKHIADKWLRALRSGKYKQATGVLKQENSEVVDGRTYPAGHCCLGVLQEVVDGDCELEPGDTHYGKLPSVEWLERNNIFFHSMSYDYDTGEYQIREHPSIRTTNNPYVCVADMPGYGDGDKYVEASEPNDTGVSFLHIANALEAAIEYTDEVNG